MWSPKSVNKIFPSQRNTNQNFGLPDGKFWWPIFLLRIRTKRTRLGPQWRFIHLPLINHDERNECRLSRLYTQFHKTAKCFKSTLYLLLSLPFGEEMYQIEELPFGSLFYVQNDLSFRVLSRRSTDRHIAHTRPQPCSISR